MELRGFGMQLVNAIIEDIVVGDPLARLPTCDGRRAEDCLLDNSSQDDQKCEEADSNRTELRQRRLSTAQMRTTAIAIAVLPLRMIGLIATK